MRASVYEMTGKSSIHKLLAKFPSSGGGTNIDYNRRLLGCLFYNDLSIMKLVLDINAKRRRRYNNNDDKK